MPGITAEEAFRTMWWERWPRAFAMAIEMAASGPDDITRWRRKKEFERVLAVVNAELLAAAKALFTGEPGYVVVDDWKNHCLCPDPEGLHGPARLRRGCPVHSPI